MTKKTKNEESRGTVIAAIYAVNKAAKKQRDLHIDCKSLLEDGQIDGFPPGNIEEELDRRGLKWSIGLNDTSFSPFCYVPAFRSERRSSPDKWPDARDTAIDELENMGIAYDDTDDYEKILAEQTALAQKAIDESQATIDGLHQILHESRECKEYLYALKASALAKLRIPFVGFHGGMGSRELYAYFAEDDYGFHMPVFFDEEEGCWRETGVDEVDEALCDLGDEVPELLNDDAISMVSATVNEEKSLGFSEGEAVAIVKEFLAG